jgi:hypothetical protein
MLGTGCGKTTIRRSRTPRTLANTGGSTKVPPSATLEAHSSVAAAVTAARIDGCSAPRSFGKANGMAWLVCCVVAGERGR